MVIDAFGMQYDVRFCEILAAPTATPGYRPRSGHPAAERLPAAASSTCRSESVDVPELLGARPYSLPSWLPIPDDHYPGSRLFAVSVQSEFA